MSTHSELFGDDLHDAFHYVQEDDPGAVGNGKYWLKVSTGVVKRRNSANDGWNNVGGGTLDYAVRDEQNTFTQKLNAFSQGLTITTEAAESSFNVGGDGDVEISNTGNVEINNAAAFNVQSVTNLNNTVFVGGVRILTLAVTSAAAIGITGLTGGGSTKLDGLASANALGKIVDFYNSVTGLLERWILLAEAHTEDGVSYVQPDDDATRSWVKAG